MQQDADRQYQLASRAAIFGRFALEHAGVPAALPAVMEDLVGRLHEPISFAVMHGNEAVIVERHEPQRPLAIRRDAERHLPLQNTASGLILLAFDSGVPSDLGAQTAERLAAARLYGYAQTREEWMGDIVEAVAVPIMQEEQCLGALSAVAPDGRMDIPLAIAALREARMLIEQQFASL